MKKCSQKRHTKTVKGQLEIYQEDGITYRPFKSVARIQAIDKKKKSRIDPRLQIPGVDHNYLSVWDAKTSPSSPLRTPSSQSHSPFTSAQVIQNSETPSASSEALDSPYTYYIPTSACQSLVENPTFVSSVPSSQIPLKVEENVAHDGLEFDGQSRFVSFGTPVQGVFDSTALDLSFGFNPRCPSPSSLPYSFDPNFNDLETALESDVNATHLPSFGPDFLSSNCMDGFNYTHSELESVSSYSGSSPPLSPEADSYDSDSWSFCASTGSSTPVGYFSYEENLNCDLDTRYNTPFGTLETPYIEAFKTGNEIFVPTHMLQATA